MRRQCMQETNAKGQKKEKIPIKLIDVLVNGDIYFDYIKYTSFYDILIRALQKSKPIDICRYIYIRVHLLWKRVP